MQWHSAPQFARCPSVADTARGRAPAARALPSITGAGSSTALPMLARFRAEPPIAWDRRRPASGVVTAKRGLVDEELGHPAQLSCCLLARARRPRRWVAR